MTAQLRWRGQRAPQFDTAGVRAELERLTEPCHVVTAGAGIGAVAGGEPGRVGEYELLAHAAPIPPQRLGSYDFRTAHGVRLAYMAGSMARGIASEALVIAMANAGLLASFGAARLAPDRIAAALDRFAADIPGLPFACSLIHSPAEPRMERSTVDLYLRREVRCVEASAFMDLTPDVVRYRVAGLRRDNAGGVGADNRVIAKVSRPEIAEKFMRPAPEPMLRALVGDGLISAEQAELARHVSVADDITVEADSGGHTDRRPTTAITSAVLGLRERIRRESGYRTAARIGAAGGMGTPQAVAAAFAMGVDYVVTGSVNQSCVEAGTSVTAKQLLAGAGLADYAMAPAADMFELGVDVQVLKRGTMFPMRAARLRELYRSYDGLDSLPGSELRRLEEQLFRAPVEDIWAECVRYFNARDPVQISRAENDPKHKMALVFRWYLGMSSDWAGRGVPDRVQDYQLWCSPAMGAFNEWVAGSHLAALPNRAVVEVAEQLMTGAAYHLRLLQLRLAGAALSAAVSDYRPAPPGE